MEYEIIESKLNLHSVWELEHLEINPDIYPKVLEGLDSRRRYFYYYCYHPIKSGQKFLTSSKNIYKVFYEIRKLFKENKLFDTL